MRRILGLAVVAAVVAGAAVLPAPDPAGGPEFTGAAPPAPEVAATASTWYCTWVDSGDVRDSDYVMAAVPEVTALVTLPSPIPNEVADVRDFRIAGPGARLLDVDDLVRIGPAPGFVEFDDGPAAAAVAVTSESALSGDQCTRSISKVWYLPGLTTRAGRTATLRLFNPFREPAKASVSGVSEFGAVPLPELSPVDVAGRSWVDVTLNPSIPFFDDLVLIIESEQGTVIPAAALSIEDGDEASWPASGLSATWEFPVVRTGGLSPDLVVANPGVEPITVDIDVFSLDGPTPLATTIEVFPEAPTRLPLEDLADGPFGIRLTASAPVAAAVVAEDPVPEPTEGEEGSEEEETPVIRLAGTIGARQPASRWLLPAAGDAPDSGEAQDARASIWIMNANPEAVTITLQPLGSRSYEAEKLRVEPGTLARINLPRETGAVAHLIDGSLPISASVTLVAERGIAYIAGVAVEE
jgi:hypothetical protein